MPVSASPPPGSGSLAPWSPLHSRGRQGRTGQIRYCSLDRPPRFRGGKETLHFQRGPQSRKCVLLPNSAQTWRFLRNRFLGHEFALHCSSEAVGGLPLPISWMRKQNREKQGLHLQAPGAEPCRVLTGRDIVGGGGEIVAGVGAAQHPGLGLWP